jgi:hypothetical protein
VNLKQSILETDIYGKNALASLGGMAQIELVLFRVASPKVAKTLGFHYCCADTNSDFTNKLPS